MTHDSSMSATLQLVIILYVVAPHEKELIPMGAMTHPT
eukprot:CAMPEP_0179462072 /NCGR_PEP_ID=MMETSP0799-20121207/44571_1 /TAXON_ID=46947 /ORGANISM="Geminigera cryophila, Strain CCMP2564" /LENGTH=37 /DNA_ID= /DNA_START= /DNA_END= /DNA_ORIENTATION=